MCGRIVITHPTDEMARIFDARPDNDLPELPNYNLCPTDPVSVVLPAEDGPRRLVRMRWGFLPHWYETPNGGPLLINARAETIAEKPAFRAAVRDRRCLIPASGFYEWTQGEAGEKLPWFIHPQPDRMMAFAGIWQDWSRGEASLRTCAVVTTAAVDAMGTLHRRMPVEIAPEDWDLWLGERGRGAAPLMAQAGSADWIFHRVDPRVNSNRASGAGLIDPVQV